MGYSPLGLTGVGHDHTLSMVLPKELPEQDRGEGGKE